MTRKTAVRGLLSACMAGLVAGLMATAAISAEPTLDVEVLNPTVVNPTVGAVISGSLDEEFSPVAGIKPQHRGASDFWLRIKSAEPPGSAGIPVMVRAVTGHGLPRLR